MKWPCLVRKYCKIFPGFPNQTTVIFGFRPIYLNIFNHFLTMCAIHATAISYTHHPTEHSVLELIWKKSYHSMKAYTTLGLKSARIKILHIMSFFTWWKKAYWMKSQFTVKVLYIPSTINIWKKVVTKAIWADTKWAGFWQISLYIK